ncbi:unnamed protein product [Gongylonema pulchrum]|uniref:Myb-like domain-containing protein n=1 Tax=Gongylonema pulchrum TaxID=637853 RepID=A0A183D2K1_9BILA|nr:unnamed protein product [Gongylonema pulchrum]
MPAKWKMITTEQKQFLMHQMLIPDDILKCCPACHKKISKQLDMLLGGELDEQMAVWQRSSVVLWSSDDVEALRSTVTLLGTDDWQAVAEKLSRKYNAEQCREQHEKMQAVDGCHKKEAESEEDDMSDDDREMPRTLTAEAKIEVDPSGESSATLSADETANQEECAVLSPAVVKSPSTHLYKPRFRGTSQPASEVATSPFDATARVKKEPDVLSSPLTQQRSDASASSTSDHGDVPVTPVHATAAPVAVAAGAGSALLATLTASTPDSTPTPVNAFFFCCICTKMTKKQFKRYLMLL